MIHIVIEGLDGSGKSTLIKQLHETLLADTAFCRWIYATKEPGLAVNAMAGIEFNRPGPDIRSMVLTDETLSPFERELFFYVDASQHRRFIENQKDAIILSDRGLWSHLAYARACLKQGQLTYTEYALCQKVIDEVCPKPLKVIYLQGTLELMKERLAGKKKDLIEANGDKFFSTVLETYNDLSTHNSNCLVLNAKNSTSYNVEVVIKWLKEEFSNEQLRTGTI